MSSERPGRAERLEDWLISDARQARQLRRTLGRTGHWPAEPATLSPELLSATQNGLQRLHQHIQLHRTLSELGGAASKLSVPAAELERLFIRVPALRGDLLASGLMTRSAQLSGLLAANLLAEGAAGPLSWLKPQPLRQQLARIPELSRSHLAALLKLPPAAQTNGGWQPGLTWSDSAVLQDAEPWFAGLSAQGRSAARRRWPVSNLGLWSITSELASSEWLGALALITEVAYSPSRDDQATLVQALRALQLGPKQLAPEQLAPEQRRTARHQSANWTELSLRALHELHLLGAGHRDHQSHDHQSPDHEALHCALTWHNARIMGVAAVATRPGALAPEQLLGFNGTDAHCLFLSPQEQQLMHRSGKLHVTSPDWLRSDDLAQRRAKEGLAPTPW